MRFCEASAKDNFNVDEIFLKLVNDILNKVDWFLLEILCRLTGLHPVNVHDSIFISMSEFPKPSVGKDGWM